MVVFVLLLSVIFAFNFSGDSASVKNIAHVIAEPTKDSQNNLAQQQKHRVLNISPKSKENPMGAPTESEEENNAKAEALLRYNKWHKAVGFPEIEQYRSYKGMPLEELSLLAASSNIEAKYVFGLRLAQDGDEVQSNEVLIDAVAEGSIAAAELLRDIYSGSAQKAFDSDRSVSYAWQKVAQAMGAKPDFLGETRFSDPEEQLLAELLYFEYLSMVQQLHFDRYGVSLPFNPQP